MDKNKKLSLISIILCTVAIIIACMMMKNGYNIKLEYYLESRLHTISYSEEDFWNNSMVFLTLLPMILLVTTDICAICFKKKTAVNVLLVISTMSVVISISFDIFSLFGAAMCLDREWGEKSYTLASYHFKTLLPVAISIFGITAFKNRIKEKSENDKKISEKKTEENKDNKEKIENEEIKEHTENKEVNE